MKAPDRPSLVIIAGPNGSGKSTLTRALMARGVAFGDYINPDEIAADLTGQYADRVAHAQRIADERRFQAISGRRSFAFETVMSHPSKLDVLRAGRAAAFFVQMFFVATRDPLINVARVADRVSKGGHDVPMDRIVARYDRTLQLLPEALLLCDQATLFDNSGDAIAPCLQVACSPDAVRIGARTNKGLRGLPSWVTQTIDRLIEISAVPVISDLDHTD